MIWLDQWYDVSHARDLWRRMIWLVPWCDVTCVTFDDFEYLLNTIYFKDVIINQGHEHMGLILSEQVPRGMNSGIM